MGTGYMHYAGLKGSKQLYVGVNPDVYAYNTIADAVTAAGDGDTIYIEPGTWTLTSQLSITKAIGLVGLGAVGSVKITSALTTSTVSLNVPALSAQNPFIMYFQNIVFDCTGAAGDGVRINNNGGAAKAFRQYFFDCSFTSSSGYGINQSHGTNTVNQQLHIIGKSPAINSMAACNFTQARAADQINIWNMNCTGAFTLDANALASVVNMKGCVYASAAQTTGGGVGKLLNYVGNMYGAAGLAGALTKGVATDFDATGTEAAILFA